MHFRKIYALVFSLALTAFSVYALLDTFVITRVYTTVETVPAASAAQPEAESAPDAAFSAEALSATRSRQSESEYEDENLRISLQNYREYDTTIYVADVTLKSTDLLKTAFSRNSYGKNVTDTTSRTAESFGALLAVNGDNYGSREKGYVIRNGVLYRDTAAKGQEDLVIWADGSFTVIDESQVTAQELLADGAMQVFSFGPGLIENGAITVGTADEVDRARASNPRTAVGMIEEGHYVFVVADGRTEESEGLSLYELAQFMQRLGVQTAYNLDGGGSSTMVFQGAVVNNPTGGRKSAERAVTDILYIGY